MPRSYGVLSLVYVQINREYVELHWVMLWQYWTKRRTLTVERELSNDFCSSEVPCTRSIRWKIKFLEYHYMHNKPVRLLRSSACKVCHGPTVIIGMIKSCNFEEMRTKEDYLFTIGDLSTRWMPISGMKIHASLHVQQQILVQWLSGHEQSQLYVILVQIA